MTTKTNQARALTLSTLAFTVCFAIWTVFSILGVQIKQDLGLNDTQFGNHKANDTKPPKTKK